MKKHKYIKIGIIVAILVLVSLGILSPFHDRSGYVLYVASIGPNDQCDKSWCRITSSEDGNPYTIISRYDIENGSEKELFRVDNTENDKIHDMIVRDDKIFFLMSTYPSKVKGRDYSIKCIDADGTNPVTIYELSSNSEPFLYLKDDKICFEVDSSNGYILDEDELELIPAQLERNMLYYGPASDRNTDVYYEMSDGTGVVLDAAYFKKEARNAAFENYTITEQDGIIYGVVVLPRKQLTEFRETSHISDMPNCDVKKEVLCTYDPVSGKTTVLFDTKNNNKRIVGYTKDAVFYYSKFNVYKYDMNTRKTQKVAKIKPFIGNKHVTFRWIGNTLLAYDGFTNEIWGTYTYIN